MKKVYLLITIVFLGCLVGCDKIMDTPTKQVEALMSKYQMLDDDIKTEINDYLNNENLTNEQRQRYYKVLEEQFKNLSYDIKEEEINGDEAIVTVEIEVNDYKSAINASDGTANDRLDKLEHVKDKVKYTLDINVIKEDKLWKVSYLTNADRKKIMGLY